LLTKHLVSLL